VIVNYHLVRTLLFEGSIPGSGLEVLRKATRNLSQYGRHPWGGSEDQTRYLKNPR